MSAQFGARLAAVGSAWNRHFTINLAIRGIVLAAAVATFGCTPATTRLRGADPADPSAAIGGAAYRSTVAPYTRLRPSTPASWRELNDGVVPPPKPERGSP